MRDETQPTSIFSLIPPIDLVTRNLGYVREITTGRSRSGQPISPGYQQLWDHPSSLIAIHSFGHQILRSLQLFARVDPREVNFSVVKEVGDRNHYAGYFYDTSHGGNGASEAMFKHMAELASTAAIAY